MSNENPEDNGAWDAAVSARLRRLASLPVDTSSLERTVVSESAVVRTRTTSRAWWAGTLRPVRAIAASLVLVASVVTAIMLSASSGPVYAQPAQMAAMHRELVDGKGMMMRVDSIDAAKHALAGQWAHAPGLPDLPERQVMACCLRQMNDKKVACVLLNDGGVPVSLMVADGNEVRSTRASTVTRDGATYEVSASAELNMVMTKRDGRWVCLIGERSVDRLIELSKGLQF